MFESAGNAVFLSYASQDVEAAKRIAEALRRGGVEVWLDQDALVGGDAWDAKIRRQISTCALFAPIISANTQARLEGYFRIEWKLAAQRTHAMADEKAFLVPIVIDDTRDDDAKVPAEFKAVQWTRLSAGETPPRFCERVKSLLDGSAVKPGLPYPGEHGKDAAPPAKPAPRPKVSRRVPAAAWLATVIAVAIIAYLALRPAASPPHADALTPREKSLAVLPFDNLSDDKTNEIFSDNITRDLINALGGVPGLTVKAPASSFYFKEQKQKIPPREMAAQLGVAYLVQGGVQKLGNTVRVSVQLSRAATDEIVWSSDPMRRELSDVFAIQEEIVALVAKKLSLALGTPAAAAKSIDQEAYVLYLQGMELWRNRLGPDYLEKLRHIESMMRRVLATEQDFVPAQVRLAEAIAFGEGGVAPLDTDGRPRPALVEALQRADRAIELDRSSAEAHMCRAVVLEQSWRRSESAAAYQRAIQNNPNFALARARYARLLEADGRMEEALAELERATLLDPLAARAHDNLALMLMHAGRFRAALAAAERSLALASDNYQALFYKALALFSLGRNEAASAVARKLASMEASPHSKSDFAGYTCDLLFRAGRRDEATKLFEQIPLTLVADRIYAAALLGRKGDALAELTAQWLPSFWIDEVLWNPHFDGLRPEPEFVAWLKKVGLTEAHARAQAWRAAHPPEKTPGK